MSIYHLKQDSLEVCSSHNIYKFKNLQNMEMQY